MKKLSLGSLLRRPTPDPEPRCECPIKIRDIDRPLAHSKRCPVRETYDRFVEEQTKMHSERRWAA